MGVTVRGNRRLARRGLSTVWSGLAAPAIILAVQLVWFGMPLGLWVRGVVLGLLTALLAIGMALVYRANRVINFAQADLGSAPTALVVGLTVFWGWSYWLGLGIGLVAALVLGGVVEVALVRRFRQASRLVLTVATIGIATLLVALAIIVPRLWGRNAASERIQAPFQWTFEIGSVVLSANDLVAAIVAPAAMVAVAVFLGRTRTGLAVRAAADRGDRAAMLGIPVARLSTVVWSLAAGLSFLSLFLQATVLGAPMGSAIRVTALVQALAALVIGRMTRLPTIALTAVALGVLEYGVRWNHDDPALADPLMAAAVLIALLLQRRQESRRDNDLTSTWRGVEQVRPLPPAVAALPAVRLATAGLVAAGAIGLWLIPTLLRVDQVIKATAIVIFAVIGLSLVVLTGWAGQISLGQMGIVAIGAAVGATVTSRWDIDLSLALVIGAAAGAVTAFLIGLPALRLRGLYLAVTTLAFALAVQSWLLNEKWFHWFPSSNQRLDRPPLFGRIPVDGATSYYWYTVVVAVLVFVAVIGIRRSRTGRVIVGDPRQRAGGPELLGVGRAGEADGLHDLGCHRRAGRGAPGPPHPGLQPGQLPPGRERRRVRRRRGRRPRVGVRRRPRRGATCGARSGSSPRRSGICCPAAAGVLFVLLVVPGGLASLAVRVRDVFVGAVRRGAERSAGADAASATAAPTHHRQLARTGAGAVRTFAAGVRHPGRWLHGVCAGQPAFPLVVLFLLNAVDELDRTAFGILLPEIRESFGLDLGTMLGIVALAGIAALALQVPIAQLADRARRIPLVVGGALVWACFSGLTGLATTVVVLTIARSGSAVGKAVIDPTHNSLLADYYPIEARHKVFSTHRAANAVGSFVGPLAAGMLAYAFGWRVPFLVFIVPTVVVAVLAMRLREPVRGRWERLAAGAADDVAGTEEPSPSYAESWRIAHKVPTLRRIWWSLPFLAVSLVGFVVLAALMYDQEFGLDERARGVAAAIAEPFQLVGLVYGARIATRRYATDLPGLMRFLVTSRPWRRGRRRPPSPWPRTSSSPSR